MSNESTVLNHVEESDRPVKLMTKDEFNKWWGRCVRVLTSMTKRVWRLCAYQSAKR